MKGDSRDLFLRAVRGRATATGDILYRDAALADGRGPELSLGVSVLVSGGRISWIRPASDEGPLPGDYA
jgi:hypothetical protein